MNKKARKKYRCQICRKRFSLEQGAWTHQAFSHPDLNTFATSESTTVVVECLDCSSDFLNDAEFDSHGCIVETSSSPIVPSPTSIELATPDLSESNSTPSTTDKNAIEAAAKPSKPVRKVDKKKFFCPLCPREKSVPTRNAMWTHIAFKHPTASTEQFNEEYPCPHSTDENASSCSAVFLCPKDLSKHINKVHSRNKASTVVAIDQAKHSNFIKELDIGYQLSTSSSAPVATSSPITSPRTKSRLNQTDDDCDTSSSNYSVQSIGTSDDERVEVNVSFVSTFQETDVLNVSDDASDEMKLLSTLFANQLLSERVDVLERNLVRLESYWTTLMMGILAENEQEAGQGAGISEPCPNEDANYCGVVDDDEEECYLESMELSLEESIGTRVISLEDALIEQDNFEVHMVDDSHMDGIALENNKENNFPLLDLAADKPSPFAPEERRRRRSSRATPRSRCPPSSDHDSSKHGDVIKETAA